MTFTKALSKIKTPKISLKAFSRLSGLTPAAIEEILDNSYKEEYSQWHDYYSGYYEYYKNGKLIEDRYLRSSYDEKKLVGIRNHRYLSGSRQLEIDIFRKVFKMQCDWGSYDTGDPIGGMYESDWVIESEFEYKKGFGSGPVPYFASDEKYIPKLLEKLPAVSIKFAKNVFLVSCGDNTKKNTSVSMALCQLIKDHYSL